MCVCHCVVNKLTNLLTYLCRLIAPQASDSGTYLCLAKNSLGSILTVTQLTVRGISTLVLRETESLLQHACVTYLVTLHLFVPLSLSEKLTVSL